MPKGDMTENEFHRLESKGIRTTESEYFKNVVYGVNDKGLMVYAGQYGSLAICKEHVTDFAMELMEVYNALLKGVG
jgi:hypothetical protein